MSEVEKRNNLKKQSNIEYPKMFMAENLVYLFVTVIKIVRLGNTKNNVNVWYGDLVVNQRPETESIKSI